MQGETTALRFFSLKGFFPFYAVIFLNAAVDLGHKITIQNTVFKLYEGDERVLLTAIVNALILLPYVFFFAAAGYVNDRLAKARVMQCSAWIALLLACSVLVFYRLGWFWCAFASVALLGTQSAFFGPAKLAYIRVMFQPQQISMANGLAQAVVIVSILFASLGFSIGFESLLDDHVLATLSKGELLQQMQPIAVLLIFVALLEVFCAYRIPIRTQQDVQQEKNKNNKREAMISGLSQLKLILKDPLLRAVVFGLTMFWSSGQVLLAVFPEYFASRTGETSTAVIQAILACLALGVGIGSVLAGVVSKKINGLNLVALGSAGLVLSLFMVMFADSILLAVLCFLFAGFMGGLYIVPLYTMMQLYVPQATLGRTLAANNLVQNLSMVCFLIATVMAALVSFSPRFILAGVLLYALVMSTYCLMLLNASRSKLSQFAVV